MELMRYLYLNGVVVNRLEKIKENMKKLLILCVMFISSTLLADSIVMWLDTRASTNDQKLITQYIKSNFNDNVEIDFTKLGIWHIKTNYEIKGWVLSADYMKTIKRGVDIQELIKVGIPGSVTNLSNPEYVKWNLTSNYPAKLLIQLGYIQSTNIIRTR